MFFLKRQKLPEIPTEPDSQILLCSGGFYREETPQSPSNKLYCLCPTNEDDIEFLNIAMESAIRIMGEFPTVVNLMSCIDTSTVIREDPIVQQFVKAGGSPIFVGSRSLITVTAGADQKLLDYISEESRWFYELAFYGFKGSLLTNLNGSKLSQFGQYPLALRVYLHAEHDYMTVETDRTMEPYVEHIRKACEKYGRILTREDC